MPITAHLLVAAIKTICPLLVAAIKTVANKRNKTLAAEKNVCWYTKNYHQSGKYG